MNDPHVAILKYRLQTGVDVSYKAGTTINWSTPAFDGDMCDGLLTLKMKTHHATVGNAQDAVREFLKSWEIQSGLDLGVGYLAFEFDSSEVIDRNPSPPGRSGEIAGHAISCFVVGGTATHHITKSSYPPPPTDFTASPIVHALWQRYRRFEEGKEPLTGMGYFCLSVLQADAGGRKKVPAQYSVHIDVLDTLGRLTSEVGDETSARKQDAGSTFRPHTQSEVDWIKAAVKRLIRRAGEVAANPTFTVPIIQISDLPAI